MPPAYLIADCFISTAAFFGLVVLRSVVLRQDATSPLRLRLLFAIHLVALLLVSRMLFWLTDMRVFVIAFVAAAGFIPLATLVLTEGLLRRHAPTPMKVITAGGAVVFTVLVLLPPRLVESWGPAALLGFQLSGFLMAGFLVLFRDRDSLSASENRALVRIGLSLIVFLPLIATDFRGGLFNPPARLGGIAILVLCWLMLSLGQRTVSHRDTIRTFAVMLAVAAAGGAVLGAITDGTVAFYTQAIAITLAATLLSVIWKDSVGLHAEWRRRSLIGHLADGDISGMSSFLMGLQSHPLVEGALILNADDLGDFDVRRLMALLERRPVLRLADTVLQTGLDAQDVEQVAWLFEKYEATHVMLVSTDPLMIFALNTPSISATPGAETELRAVQRMALLVSRQD